jgi:hypothetical protein
MRDPRLDTVLFLPAGAIVSGLLLASILARDIFPSAFVEGSGQTPFKV